MTTQKVVNNPLGSYPVSVDRTAMGELRQAVGIDIGDVTADVWTPSRVSAANPLPVSGTLIIDSGVVTIDNGGGGSAVNIQDGGNSITIDATSLPLPADAATETTLAALNTKITTTTTFTDTITAVSDTVTVTLGQNKYVDLEVSGTYNNVNIAFQVSLDNVTWLSIQMKRFDSNTIETASASITNTTRAWRANCGAALYFRVIANTWSSGTMNVIINTSDNKAEPVPGIPSHAVTGSGTFAATQSGTWSVRAQDGSGNLLSSAVVPPGVTDRGLTVRQVGVYGAPSTTTSRTVIPQLPHGYYFYSSRTTTTGSTATSIVVTADASTQCRRGDIVRVGSGTHAQGLYEWGVVASVATTTISLDTQTPLSLAITNGLTIQIWKPGFISVDVDNAIKTNTTVAGGLINTTPISTNKTFFEGGSLDFASITNTMATFYTTTNQGYMCEISNTTDVELGYSIDGGSTEHFIPSGQVSSWNLMDIGGFFSGGEDIQVYYPGTAPSKGRISFMLAYY